MQGAQWEWEAVSTDSVPDFYTRQPHVRAKPACPAELSAARTRRFDWSPYGGRRGTMQQQPPLPDAAGLHFGEASVSSDSEVSAVVLKMHQSQQFKLKICHSM